MGPAQMEARPPALVETIVGLLIPAACREHVLGDLNERCTTLSGYLLDAVTVIPHVVASRVRRSFDGALLLIEYIGLSTIAQSAYRTHALPYATPRPEIPLAVVLAMLVLCDAYIPTDPAPGGRGAVAHFDALFASSLVRAIRHVLIAIACGWVAEWAIRVWMPAAAIPTSVMLEMSGATFLMVGAVRAAWWTMFVPGGRVMLLRFPAVPATHSISGPSTPRFPIPHWNFGEVVWVMLAAPLLKMGWMRVASAGSVASSAAGAFILGAAGVVIVSAVRRLLTGRPREKARAFPQVYRAALNERVHALSEWPLRALLVVGAYWCDVSLRGLHGLADPALIGALSAAAFHFMGVRMKKNFQQEIDTLGQNA